MTTQHGGFTYTKKKDTKICAYWCAVSGLSTATAMPLLSSGVAHFAWDGICTPTQPGLIAIEDKDTSSSEEESRIGGWQQRKTDR